MESILDKLRALGVNIGPEEIDQPLSKKKFYPVEETVNGYGHKTTFGDTFIARDSYPFEHMHGLIKIGENVDLKLISMWAKAQRLKDIDVSQIVFLDTETSSLTGGTGTLVFMIGIGYFDNSGFQIRQLFLKSPDKESALLVALDELLSPFNTVVTYNGKTFDIPMVNSRYTINGMRSSLELFDHVDLLHITRRIWRKRIPNRTLGNIENEIIGFFRSEEEVPGWMVPEIYYDYLRDGDARPLKNVFYHNAMDVLSLAALFNHISNLLSRPLDRGDIHSIDLSEIARLYEDLGLIDFAVPIYEQSISQGLPIEYFVETLMRFASLYRKRGEWNMATSLWLKAAERKDITACIELAKFYEHQVKDNNIALMWALHGLELLYETQIRLVEKKALNELIQHRLQRLDRKICKLSIQI